jgi:hypothetical protein
MIAEEHIVDFNSENLDFDMTKMLENILNIDDEASKLDDTSFFDSNILDISTNSIKPSEEAVGQFFPFFECGGVKKCPQSPKKIIKQGGSNFMATGGVNNYNFQNFNASTFKSLNNSINSNYSEKSHVSGYQAHPNHTNNQNLNKILKLKPNPLIPDESYPDQITENFFNTFEGKFMHLIKNYNGSKLLQVSLPNTEKAIISKIFLEISRYTSELLLDPYGNYFLQKLYPILNIEEKLNFLADIQNDILFISSNSVGNYSLQFLIEHLKTDFEIDIFCSSFKNKDILLKMIAENNSIHVLEKIAMVIPENKISFLYQFVIDNFMALATNQNGLCIVKKIILCAKSYYTQMKLQNLIMNNFNSLVQHSFGNHTIQIALEVNFKILK